MACEASIRRTLWPVATKRGLMRRAATPGRTILLAFSIAIAIGTVLLMLPAMSNQPTTWVQALFTATSTICVTGLAAVDTATHWTFTGQVTMAVLTQLGGLGIMTMATLVALLFGSRMGLGSLLALKTENNVISVSDLRKVIGRIAAFSFGTEFVIGTVFTLRFMYEYDYPAMKAIGHGAFHAIMSFNGAGFALYSDSLIGFAGDGWILTAAAVGVILGGLGFPVVFELRRKWRTPREWSLLTRITLWVTTPLFILPMLFFIIVESTNPATMGTFQGGQLIALGFFTAVMPRSGGFNAFDIGAMHPESLLLTDVLMFIGGGSASTAGGIRVTTFGVLLLMMWSEIRGKPDVELGTRRIPNTNQRQAIAVTLLSAALILVVTTVTMAITQIHLEPVLFEAISAFGTVGLSMGLTPELPPAVHVMLSFLMFVGRLGPLTLGTAIALRQHKPLRTLPEERITIG